jgi:hypothetical protein
MAARESAQEVERRVGHPRDKWDALKEQVQGQAVKRFADVQDSWLDLMWTLDAFRVSRALPSGFDSLDAVNRGKGNWFADLVALLLENRTSHRIAPRANIPGFSQAHQVDVAWPARNVDPLVCCETKVTGAPGFVRSSGQRVPARKAMSDFSNRRKELKFAATDLKLFRRKQETSIGHWDVWRQDAPPKAYFLWGARMESEERIETLSREMRNLTETYLDGAGLFAWETSKTGDGYVAVQLPRGERITALDDVLYRIESYINRSVNERGEPPPPVEPSLDFEQLPGAGDTR